MNKMISVAVIAATISFAALTVGANTAMAGKNCGVSCSDPVKGNRNGNLWEVLYCVVGPASDRRTVDCKSQEAVHLLPNGVTGVCFIGSDGREHYTKQSKVWIGRKFFNQKHKGRWMINWQS
jgi:hypothetical protein